MSTKPVAAGRSSITHVDQDIVFANLIADNHSVYLDLACGAGNYTLALAQRLGADSVIHALDLWEEGVAALQESATQQGFENIKAQVADATKPLPLDDGSIDVCLMATILHDIPEAERVNTLQEVRRVLKPHGALVIIEYKKLDYGPGPKNIEARIGEADAEALLTPLGFKKDAVVDLGEYPYLIRFIKQ